MPIPNKIRRQFYSGPAWEAVRARILARAGGRFSRAGKYEGGAKCEQCGKPDRIRVWVLIGRTGEYWTRTLSRQRWTYCMLGGPGNLLLRIAEIRCERANDRLYTIRSRIAVCHLNHTPGDDRDENLRALCEWCHLNMDKLVHSVRARETRLTRKDSARPLLQAVS